jgi:hypothetical protein
MLARLSGRTHEVHTAVAVARGDRVASGVERVRVTFRSLTDEQIAAYVATGEPMDKAGAYGHPGLRRDDRRARGRRLLRGDGASAGQARRAAADDGADLRVRARCARGRSAHVPPAGEAAMLNAPQT